MRARKLLPVERRLRSLQTSALAACPKHAACDMRFSSPEQRLNYVRMRIQGADALDVGRLARRYTDCMFFVCDGAVDVYVPCRQSYSAALLALFSYVAWGAAAAACAVAMMTAFA